MSTGLPLRARIEGAIASGLSRLPAGALRPVIGPPVVRDDQQLNHEAQLTLRLLELTGASSIETMPVGEARAQIRSDATKLAGPSVPVALLRDLTVADSLPARLYVPFQSREPDPLLVYFHGGGFVVGDLDTHDNTCRFLACQAGVRVLAIDYRLAPEHPFPAAADDALAAFTWVADHTRELGADRARLAVGGDSAGGNLATVIAQAMRGESGPAFQLLFYPWVDLSHKRNSYRLFGQGFFTTEATLDWERGHYLTSEADAADPRCSPLLLENLKGVAPAYIATAGFDPLRDEGEAYATRLQEAGVRVALHRHSDLIHAFVNPLGVGRATRDALLEAAGALRVGLAT